MSLGSLVAASNRPRRSMRASWRWSSLDVRSEGRGVSARRRACENGSNSHRHELPHGRTERTVPELGLEQLRSFRGWFVSGLHAGVQGGEVRRRSDAGEGSDETGVEEGEVDEEAGVRAKARSVAYEGDWEKRKEGRGDELGERIAKFLRRRERGERRLDALQ